MEYNFFSFIKKEMFKTCGARGLNLNVIYYKLARQPKRKMEGKK